MEMDERRRVFERLQQLQGNIRVVCRVRPSLKAGAPPCVSIGSDAFQTQAAAAATTGRVATVSAECVWACSVEAIGDVT